MRGKWRAPANLHIGNMGVAPALALPANSIPPTASLGGNVDNRRFGVGASIYYPVQVAGALLSGACRRSMLLPDVGPDDPMWMDTHLAQLPLLLRINCHSASSLLGIHAAKLVFISSFK